MKKSFINKPFFVAIIIALLWLLIGNDVLNARGGRGGSFGGSRSFGRSSPSRTSSAPRSSFGGSRATSLSGGRSSSFSATKMNASRDYTTKYGAPRRTVAGNTMAGVPGNYRMNDYGGFSSGLMMGYMMGNTSMMWSMPFHPAFYYSRPYYVTNPDGTVGVYPPTFSFAKLFFTLIIVGGIAYIIYVIIRNRRRNAGSWGVTHSQSSFD
jgi:hypothetical protein